MQSAASSMRDRSKNSISVYLQLTLVCSAAVWILIIWSGHLNMGYGLVIPAIMWCPAFAALLTCRLLGRELSSLGWRWPQPKYLAAAYFVHWLTSQLHMAWSGHCNLEGGIQNLLAWLQMDS